LNSRIENYVKFYFCLNKLSALHLARTQQWVKARHQPEGGCWP